MEEEHIVIEGADALEDRLARHVVGPSRPRARASRHRYGASTHHSRRIRPDLVTRGAAPLCCGSSRSYFEVIPVRQAPGSLQHFNGVSHRIVDQFTRLLVLRKSHLPLQVVGREGVADL